MSARIVLLSLALALVAAPCGAVTPRPRATPAPSMSPSQITLPQAAPKERERDVVGCTLVFVVWPAGFREVAFARCLER